MAKNSNKKLRPKILFLVQLPPPIHGVSLMNTYVIESGIINENFYISKIDLKFVKSMDQLQKFSIFKIVTALKYCFEIVKKMLIFKPQLVYFTFTPTGFGFYRDAFYVFILKIFKTKIILHLHGKGIKKNINTFIKRSIYKCVFKNIYVICLSETLSKDIADVYNATPFIVHNGVPNHPFRRSIQTKLTNKVPQILFLANYTINKGILELVQALGILKNKGYNFNARFVGAPFNVTVEMLERFIDEHNLSENAKAIDSLTGDDKYQEFQRADIFVFPTYNDAFPLVILEAMQFGLPVISTYEGSIPDIVINNETGILVEAHNIQTLADKIADLLDDKNKRIEMGKKGYERFINNYTLNHFENSMNKTFWEILGIH